MLSLLLALSLAQPPDAALAAVERADHAFEANDLPAALRGYEAALSLDATFAYARYKLGWCHYNLGDFDRALADFAVVARGEDTVAREARKDWTRTWATAHGASGFEARAREVWRDDWVKGLRQVASTWEDQGKYEDAATAWRRLLVVGDPVEAQLGLARAASMLLRGDEVVKALRELGARLAAADAATAEQWRPEAKALLDQLTRAAALEARRTRSPDARRRAEALSALSF